MRVVEKITKAGIWFIEPSIKHIRKFNFKLIARLTGILLIFLSFCMALPIAVSLYYKDGAQWHLVLSMLASLLMGLRLRNILGNNATYELHEKESFWITSIIWIVVPLMGALPYLFTGAVDTYVDAAFESFSGFTTTGSSVIVDLDHTPAGLLVWRSITQWIGGLGLILFIIAILKKLNVGSVQLYDAEFSGTVQRKLHPHISTSVSLMWAVYTGITIILFVLLLLCGNNFLGSFCTTLSTVSTGGFMIHNAGLTGMAPMSLTFITIAMFLSGINIALIYRIYTGHIQDLLHNEEFRVYACIFLGAVLISTLSLIHTGNPVKESLSYSLFHIASTISTCGYYLPMPAYESLGVSALTFALIIIGASSGSTGGGIKLKRIMILWKYVRNYFIRMMHPNAVFCVRIDKAIISHDYVNKIFAFVFMYCMFIAGGAFVLMFNGLDIPHSLCIAAANIANLGPSPIYNIMGSHFDYFSLAPYTKWTLMTLMLVGRVEIFAIIAIFSPSYWKR